MSQETYDIIFAGGGATACVAAGRLAMIDPSLKILIIERGPHTNRGLSDISYRQPARCYYNLAEGTNFEVHVGQASKALNGRQPAVAIGKCVGGGSSVNFVMYTRASESDYDDWEKVGNPGWGSKEMIALANKAETYEIDENAPCHGFSGPIKVSTGGYRTNLGAEFLNMAKVYDPDRKITDDVANFKSANQYGVWNKYINKQTGTRSDAAHNYIYSQSANMNLKVLTSSRVVRVILEGTKAVGVEFVSDDNRENVVSVRASKYVVVSSGAFNSPTILERSGIGAKDILQKRDVKQVVDLPGVGTNYNDHMHIFLPFFGSEEVDYLGPIFTGDVQSIEKHTELWSSSGGGLLSTNGIDAGIRIRPMEKDLPILGPDFKPFWDSFLGPAPDKPLFQICPIAGCFPVAPTPGRKHYSFFYFSEYAASRGSVHIGSGTDPYAPVEWNSGFLDQAADLASMRWGYKRTLELARRVKYYQGSVTAAHPPFAKDSPVTAALTATGPAPYNAPDIVFSAEDDKVLDDFHKANVQSTWHSLGTCAMKPKEKGGVVDNSLNVYGTQNLKVADLSIAPSNVSANTYNTALMIGEKAALIIAQELGLKA